MFVCYIAGALGIVQFCVFLCLYTANSSQLIKHVLQELRQGIREYSSIFQHVALELKQHPPPAPGRSASVHYHPVCLQLSVRAALMCVERTGMHV